MFYDFDEGDERDFIDDDWQAETLEDDIIIEEGQILSTSYGSGYHIDTIEGLRDNYSVVADYVDHDCYEDYGDDIESNDRHQDISSYLADLEERCLDCFFHGFYENQCRSLFADIQSISFAKSDYCEWLNLRHRINSSYTKTIRNDNTDKLSTKSYKEFCKNCSLFVEYQYLHRFNNDALEELRDLEENCMQCFFDGECEGNCYGCNIGESYLDLLHYGILISIDKSIQEMKREREEQERLEKEHLEHLRKTSFLEYLTYKQQKYRPLT